MKKTFIFTISLLWLYFFHIPTAFSANNYINFEQFNFDSYDRLICLDKDFFDLLVKKDGKYGIYSIDNEKIVSVEYDKFLFRTKDKNKWYYYFVKDNNIYVINKNNQILSIIKNDFDKISMLGHYNRYAKLEKNGLYGWFDPEQNKKSDIVYKDVKSETGKSLVFLRKQQYTQYKKNKLYFNVEKSITPTRIILLPIELPIALMHDIGETFLIIGTVGLWAVFNGTDWWLTGKGSQGLP